MEYVTKDHFDKTIEKLDNRIDNLEVKIREDFNELGRMISAGFEDIVNRLDVRPRVEKLENKVERIERALNI
jgi:hypothetical protein